jgi:hypothetical protein
MSSREKKLLSILLLAGFLLLNLFLYSQYLQKKNLFENALETAKIELQQAKTSQDNAAQYAEQMQWLADHEPAQTDAQTVLGQLQAFIEKEAITAGLTLKPQEFLPTDTTGKHYHRAQIKISVTGREESLYRWLNAVNDPSAFRSAIQIRLNPNTQDDILIDCSAVISQWFPAEKTDS